ncbi:MAG: hypothetical protein HUJ56_06860 [Erysipelotrichaceae bacterium]|nr:hypothetical protein [Erysipelotrichaceae bacterium]
MIQKGSQLPMQQATVSSMALAMFAYVALSEAYKLLRQAQDDAALAHEYRLRVEEECNESIELIKNYRMEMNQMVSDYLTVRQETFIESFKAMDKAILDGDINGYIKANNSIQEILKYDIQFRNEDEFDALMNSDMDFKL